MIAPPAPGSFDFTTVFETALEGYQERPHVERAVLDAVDGGRLGVTVILGEPGSGKTALAAALIQQRGYLHHFLRAGHTEFHLWRDPHGWLTSLGFQLKARYGDAIFPETAAIDVQGRVRKVGETGSVVGAEIQNLVAVPWRSAELRVRLDAEDIRGKTAGVRIQRVIEDYHRIPVSAFREMALIEPLRRLKEQQPDEHVVLWVDGLDEEFDTDGTNGNRIADLLPTSDELRELGNLSVVLSSRPGAFLDRFLRSGSTRIDLDDPRFASDNQAAVERFVDRELATADRVAQMNGAGASVDDVRRGVLKACANNFLYLRQFFLAMAGGELGALLAGGLPAGLDGIYARLLERLARSVGEDRFAVEHHPTMSVLVVAAHGLSADEIAALAGIERAMTSRVVGHLLPFLDVARRDDKQVYSLYHRSLADTISAAVHADEVWYVDRETAHSRITARYLERWKAGGAALDDYGIEFLTYHLARARLEERRQLIDLVGEQWRLAKRRHHKSNHAFARDLEAAAAVAIQLPFPDNILSVARLGLMGTIFDSVAEQVPARALEVMVRLGYVQRALEYLNPAVVAEGTLIDLMADLIRGLSANGPTPPAELFELLKQGFEVCRKRSDQTDGLLATLLEPCAPTSDPRMAAALSSAVEIFNNSQRRYWETPRALSELARLIGPLNHQDADAMFHQALTAINDLASSSLSLQFSRLIKYWSAHDADGSAAAWKEQTFRPDEYVAAALATAARARHQHGDGEGLAWGVSAIREQLLPGIQDPFARAGSLVQLANLEFELGDRQGASARLAQARAAVAEMGQPSDPNRQLQNRPAQATTALIDIAEAMVDADPTQAGATLSEAWTAYANGGVFGHIDRLVQAQYRHSPDMLDVRLSERSDAGLLIHAARVSLDRDPRVAAEYFEDALVRAESPSDRNAGTGELLLRRVKATAVRDLDAALLLVEKFSLDPDTIVAWRLDQLRSLLASGDPRASQWFDETAELWCAHDQNPHFVAEFPAALRELPLKLARGLLPRAGSATQKERLLAAALGPLVQATDPEIGARLRTHVVSPSGEPQSIRRISEHQLLGFAAGQWWDVDRSFADRLLGRMLIGLRMECSTPEQRGYFDAQLSMALEDLMRGAPGAVVPLLLTHTPEPLPPNTISIVVDGLGVPPHAASGMSKEDRLLALALAADARNGQDAWKVLAAIGSPSVQCLACTTAARGVSGASADTRLEWCEIARAATVTIEPGYLKCLMLSDVAEAYQSVGAKHKAQEIAASTARDVCDNGEYFESVGRAAAYPHALGKCLQVLAVNRSYDEVAALLWKARCLGRGYRRALSYLVPALAAVEPRFLDAVADADARASQLFSS